MAANEEKERHIEELRRTMRKYKRVEEMIATSQGRKGTRYSELQHYIIDSSNSPVTNLIFESEKNVKQLLQFLFCKFNATLGIIFVCFLFRLIDSR